MTATAQPGISSSAEAGIRALAVSLFAFGFVRMLPGDPARLIAGPDATLQDVNSVRERLGLSQRRAGEVLGGGPRSFQKYESGTQAVSVPMSLLLTLLSNDPSRLNELPGAAPLRTSRRTGRKSV